MHSMNDMSRAAGSTVATLESVLARAVAGDPDSLEQVVLAIQDDVYRLAVRMLWHPDDAQDATQEILVRVITHLSSFRGDSAFRTWVYRVAANHLLTTRKRCAEQDLTFTDFGRDLEAGLSDRLPDASAADQALLVEEVKLGCTQGMLLCLDREHRIAYILGEVFELTGEQAADVLQISPAAFRKRLSRARAAVRGFMQERCGILNPASSCRCSRRVERAIKLGRVDPERLLFARHPRRSEALDQGVREMESLEYAAAELQRGPAYSAPEVLVEQIRGLLSSGDLLVLR